MSVPISNTSESLSTWGRAHGRCSEHAPERLLRIPEEPLDREEGEEQYQWGARTEAWGFLAGLYGEVRKIRTRCQNWKVSVTRRDRISAPVCDQQPLCDPVRTQLSLLGVALFPSSYPIARQPLRPRAFGASRLLLTALSLSLSPCQPGGYQPA